MKQRNTSAAVKFRMELLLILRPGSNLAVVRRLYIVEERERERGVISTKTDEDKYPDGLVDKLSR